MNRTDEMILRYAAKAIEVWAKEIERCEQKLADAKTRHETAVARLDRLRAAVNGRAWRSAP